MTTLLKQRKKTARGEGDLAETGGIAWTATAWIITLIFFAPVAWMLLTSLHTEPTPPPTRRPVQRPDVRELLGLFDRGVMPFLINSATASIISTLLVLALSIPAAYALAIRPVEKWTDVMFFFLSTKFLPAIAALLPIYLLVKRVGGLDNIWVLVILYTAMNLPIAVWMMQSFLAEVPKEIMEAAEVDGAGTLRVIWSVIVPIITPGIAATSLICFIFSWNEFLFAVNLTATVSSTSPVFLVGFITSEGLFLAKLCAAATLVSLPVLIAGFAAQDKLVRGLSLGAVK